MKNIIKVGVVLSAFFAVAAQAGTGGTEFQSVHTTFKNWIEGYAGMAISLGAVGLGGMASLGRQSPIPILTGIGTAILLNYSPTVTDAIFSATI